MSRRRILVLMHEDLVPPDVPQSADEKKIENCKTECDVVETLCGLGHEVRPLGLRDDLGVLREALEEWKPNIAFNLLEEFHGVSIYDQHVVSYMELMRQPYTGCNPRGLLLAHDKALAKKILSYHRIRVPSFAVFPVGLKVRRPHDLKYPLFVKSVSEEASLGISQASIVKDDEELEARVQFVHEQIQTDAIAEEYIEGRELYVGVMGNHRLAALPIWELVFGKMDEDMPKIATRKAKWDNEYRRRWGITSKAAVDLPELVREQINQLCKKTYRLLGLSGYARMDLRLSPQGQAYFLEANPNPDIANDAEFAESAEKAGVAYPQLIQRVLRLGLGYRHAWAA